MTSWDNVLKACHTNNTFMRKKKVLRITLNALMNMILQKVLQIGDCASGNTSLGEHKKAEKLFGRQIRK